MKKQWAMALILAIMLFAPAADAKDVTAPVFEDFFDFTSLAPGTAGAINISDGFIELRQNDGSITAEVAPDDRYGTSMKLTSVQSANGAAVNPKFSISGTAVYGLSVYLTGPDATLRLAGKYRKASGTAWLNTPLEMREGKVVIFGSEIGTYENDTWYDIRLAMRFDTHQCDVFINGERRNPAPIELPADAVGMDYFNINAAQAKSAAESAEYLDNMTAYGSCCGEFTLSTSLDSELSAVNPKTVDTIELSFDRELLPETNVTDVISLQTADGTVVEDIKITPVQWGGYIRGAQLSLDAPLAANTDYRLTVSGAADLNGSPLSAQVAFTTIDDRPVLQIGADTDFAQMPENVNVKFSLLKKNLDGYTTLQFYCNGALVGQTGIEADDFDVQIAGGKNEIYAVATGSGDALVSNTATVYGIAYQVNEEVLFQSFLNADSLGTFPNFGPGAGDLSVVYTDDAHQNSLRFLGKQSQGSNTNTYINTPNFKGKTGITLIEGDFRWDILAPLKQAVTNFKVSTKESGEIFFAPINITVDGAMVLTYGNGQELTLVEQVDTGGRWYAMRVYVDCINKDITVVIDNELKAYRLPLSNQDVTDIAYLHLSIGGFNADYETLFYLDNLKINKVSAPCTVTSPQADTTIHYAAGTEIVLQFSEPMQPTLLGTDTILLKDANGASVPYLPALSEDGTRYTLTIQTALSPNAQYTVSFTDRVKSANGGALTPESQVTVTTEKLPFGLDSFRLTQEGAAVTVRNRDAEERRVVLAAGIYTAANQLVGFNTASVVSTRDGMEFVIPLPKDAISADRQVRVFLLDNMTELHTLDMIR